LDSLLKQEYKPDRAAAEIKAALETLKTSRGFRGQVSILDKLTHNMSEMTELSVYGNVKGISHSRLVTQIVAKAKELKSRVVTIVDNEFKSKLQHFLDYAKVESLGFTLHLRAHVLGVPVLDITAESPYKTKVSVAPGRLEVPRDTDMLVWLCQEGTQKKEASYLTVADYLFKDLRTAFCPSVRTLFVPLQLGPLEPTSPFVEIIQAFAQGKLLPMWSRAHNSELWFQFSDRHDGDGTQRVAAFLKRLVLQSRRMRAVNMMRDHLLSHGLLFEKIGYFGGFPLHDDVMQVFSKCRHVVVGASKLASTLTLPSAEPSTGSIDLQDMQDEFGKMGVEIQIPKPLPPPPSAVTRDKRKESTTPPRSGSNTPGSQPEEEEEVESPSEELEVRRRPKEVPPAEKPAPKAKEPSTTPRENTSNARRSSRSTVAKRGKRG